MPSTIAGDLRFMDLGTFIDTSPGNVTRTEDNQLDPHADETYSYSGRLTYLSFDMGDDLDEQVCIVLHDEAGEDHIVHLSPFRQLQVWP